MEAAKSGESKIESDANHVLCNNLLSLGGLVPESFKMGVQK